MDELEVRFGEELVAYAIGASSCAVPGVPAGLDALWRAHGRLPWERPGRARAGARRVTGVRMPKAQASCLRDARAGDDDARGRAHLRARRPAPPGGRQRSSSPDWSPRSSSSATRGPASVYEGSIAHELCSSSSRSGRAGSPRPTWPPTRQSGPSLRSARYAGRTVCSRGDLSGVPEALGRLPAPATNGDLLAVLDGSAPGRGAHDEHHGRRRARGTPACSRRASGSARATGCPASTFT